MGDHNDRFSFCQCIQFFLNFKSIFRAYAVKCLAIKIIGGSFMIACAIGIRCFLPQDKVPPPEPIKVS